MKVLITGGAGFIGSHVAEYYAKKGDDVVCYDNLSRAELLKKEINRMYNWNYLKNFSKVELEGLIVHELCHMKDFESMSAQELVVFAQERGLSRKILGLTLQEVKAMLKETMKGVEESEQDSEITSLSWIEVKKLAKEKGIQIYRKTRKELEVLLSEKEPIII